MEALGQQWCHGAGRFVARRFGDDQGVGGDAARGAQVGQGTGDEVLVVGGIEEDHAGGFAWWCCLGVDGEDGGEVLGPAGGDIGAERDKGGAVALDKGGVGGAAR